MTENTTPATFTVTSTIDGEARTYPLSAVESYRQMAWGLPDSHPASQASVAFFPLEAAAQMLADADAKAEAREAQRAAGRAIWARRATASPAPVVQEEDYSETDRVRDLHVQADRVQFALREADRRNDRRSADRSWERLIEAVVAIQQASAPYGITISASRGVVRARCGTRTAAHGISDAVRHSTFPQSGITFAIWDAVSDVEDAA